jgi:hypothetical protein
MNDKREANGWNTCFNVYVTLSGPHVLYGSATTTSQAGWNFTLGLHSESQ